MASTFNAVRSMPLAWRALATALAVVAIAFAGVVGDAPASAIVVLGLAAVAAGAIVFAEPEDRLVLLGAVVLGFIARALVATALEGYLRMTAPGSVFAPDELVYLGAGHALAVHWHDPAAPFDASDAHLTMLNVQLIGAIFWAIGPNVLVIKLLNSFFGAFAPLMLYRAMRNVGLPGARLATLIVLFFPSLFLWSTLALKDPYVEVCLLGAVWTSSELIRTKSYWWIPATAAFLIALESVRRYGYFAIALAWLAVPIAFATWRDRLRAGTAITATVALLFVIFNPLSDAGSNPLYLFILTRGSAAERAGSAFVEPFPVVRGNPGDQFVVSVAGQTPRPGTTPAIVTVANGMELVVEGSSPHGQGLFVVIRPGDTVVIGGVAGSSPPPPQPGRTPEIIVLNPEAKNLVGPASLEDSDSTSVSGSLLTNLRSLPLGMLYVAFGPFPWAARTLGERVAIPEMLLWYVLVILAILGIARLVRGRSFAFAHAAVFLGGMFVALSLISANTGTLIRSRAMIVPFVIAFAAVAADPLLRRWVRDTRLRRLLG